MGIASLNLSYISVISSAARNLMPVVVFGRQDSSRSFGMTSRVSVVISTDGRNLCFG